MELPLEAQLNTAEEAGETVPSGDRRNLVRAQVLCRLDHYLSAAGVGDATERTALIGKASEILVSQCDLDKKPAWSQMIAIVDRLLAERHEIDTGGEPQLSCRGRLAEVFSAHERSGIAQAEALGRTADWGTPPRHYRAMPDQELTVRSPSFSRLFDPSTWRPAQNFVVSLSCLAVILIP